MVKDRLPDLIRLARADPKTYNEPEVQEEVLMPADIQLVLQRTEKILKFLGELQSILEYLKRQHQNVLTSSSVLNTHQLRIKITQASNRFSAISRKTENILKRIQLSDQEMLRYFSNQSSSVNQDDNFSVKWDQQSSSVKVNWRRDTSSNPVYIPAEIRMQILLHDVLSKRLTNLVGDFYTEQKNYNVLSQKKIERQLSILGKTMKQEEIDRVLDENIPLLHADIRDDTQVSKEMRLQLDEMAHYEKEILQLEKNITQLHSTFLVISQFVYEQGAMVDQIERHVIMAQNYVGTGTQSLKKAGKLQNKYRKKKLILAIVILVALGIIAAIITTSIVTKRQNRSSNSNPHR